MIARNRFFLRFTNTVIRDFLWLPFCCVLLLQGCSVSQLYTAGQQMQKSTCGRLVDPWEQQRCMERAGMSYDTYQREMGTGRGSE